MKKLTSIFLSAAIIFTLIAGSFAAVQASEGSTVKEKLIGKWTCYQCVSGGKKFAPADYYGSVVRQTGAYIKFKNNKFSCNLGIKGFSGKFTVAKNGKITLKATKEWDGKGAYKKSKNYTVKIAKNYKKIAFKAFGAKNYFKKK